jgi:putative endonuclease
MNFRRIRAAHLRLGRAGERAAARYLALRGCRILARNARTFGGELDIVALDGGVLLFVEVKTLREKAGFTPIGNLSPAQRRRNHRAAMHYMALLPIRPVAWRFDLIEVVYRKNRVVTLRRHIDYLPPGGSDIIAQILARRPFWGYII